MLSRLPGALSTASVFLLGAWAGGILEDRALAAVGGIIGAILGLAALAMQTRSARKRWPRLATERSRLGRLYGEVLDLRSGIKQAWKANTVTRPDWDHKVSALETRLWKEIGDVLPDDVRAIQRGLTSFAVANSAGYRSDHDWGRAMMDLLEARLTMLRHQMELLRK